MSKQRFKVTIHNWEKHQSKLKPGHTHFMLSKRFFDDEKIALLKQNECLLFINLLAIAADLMSNSCVIHCKLLPNLLRIDDKSLANCLERLQSLQLLTYEKSDPLLKEKKEKEKKGKEKNPKGAAIKKPEPPQADDSPQKVQAELIPSENNRLDASRLIGLYCECWKESYKTGSNPIIGRKEAGMMKTLLQNHGAQKCEKIIRSYLKMPDSWFFKKRHDIPTMISNLNSISLYMEKGRVITQKEINDMDKNMATQNLIRDIQENGI